LGFSLAKQRGLAIDILALLGFQDEAVAAVEVDPPSGRTAVVGVVGDAAFVMIVAGTAARGVG